MKKKVFKDALDRRCCYPDCGKRYTFYKNRNANQWTETFCKDHRPYARSRYVGPPSTPWTLEGDRPDLAPERPEWATKENKHPSFKCQWTGWHENEDPCHLEYEVTNSRAGHYAKTYCRDHRMSARNRDARKASARKEEEEKAREEAELAEIARQEREEAEKHAAALLTGVSCDTAHETTKQALECCKEEPVPPTEDETPQGNTVDVNPANGTGINVEERLKTLDEQAARIDRERVILRGYVAAKSLTPADNSQTVSVKARDEILKALELAITLT